MQIFSHHIYEYKKGLRNLILHTTSKAWESQIIARLEKEGIPYMIYPAGDKNINVFFGNENCIEVIRVFNKVSLNDYSDEEDFILGTMLGYDRIQQCQRYIKRKRKHLSLAQLVG